MDTHDVCRRLYDAGITLSSDGDRLLAAPADCLTDELRALIREHKAALLRLLEDANDITEALLAWAMRTCDRHGDGLAAREAMRRECLATPPHLRADLLDHFSGGKRGAQ